MPEVIKNDLSTQSIADLPRVYQGIWASHKHDVEKYASNESNTRIIKSIMNTAHLYLDQPIKFQNFGNANDKSHKDGKAILKLNDARIIQMIYPSTSIANPSVAD
jgi:hypothetical protein